MASDVYTQVGEEYVITALSTALGSGAAIQSGEGVTAAAKGDTALQTAVGSKQSGLTKSTPTNDVLRFVGTISYAASHAITEVGLFADVTTGPLIQRHTFDVVNVGDGDSIEFTVEHEQA